eukprot:tig00021038_g17580.t1
MAWEDFLPNLGRWEGFLGRVDSRGDVQDFPNAPEAFAQWGKRLTTLPTFCDVREVRVGEPALEIALQRFQPSVGCNLDESLDRDAVSYPWGAPPPGLRPLPGGPYVWCPDSAVGNGDAPFRAECSLMSSCRQRRMRAVVRSDYEDRVSGVDLFIEQRRADANLAAAANAVDRDEDFYHSAESAPLAPAALAGEWSAAPGSPGEVARASFEASDSHLKVRLVAADGSALFEAAGGVGGSGTRPTLASLPEPSCSAFPLPPHALALLPWSCAALYPLAARAPGPAGFRIAFLWLESRTLLQLALLSYSPGGALSSVSASSLARA